MEFYMSAEDLSELKRCQRNLVGTSFYVKVTCILMIAKGCCAQNVSDCLDIDISTVYLYRNTSESKGLSSYIEDGNKGYWEFLSSSQISILRTELKNQIYTDSKSVAAWIKSTFYIEYTSQGGVDLLNRIGFTYKKTKEVPCECDSEKQVNFAKELSELFDKLDDKSVVYYADGVHPTHNFRSTYAWIEKGSEFDQPTVSGRDRGNINGLLNAKNVSDVIALDCESVNSGSTKKLYQAALEKHPQAEHIYILSDNARYYKNKELTEWIEGTRITQIFLTPYSANLNLIERLWRFMRKKVINTCFYRKLDIFKKALKDFFGNIADYKQELESLLTLNFRLSN